MRERIQRRERRIASVIENPLELCCSFRASSKFQVSSAAQVLRPEFGGGFVTRGCLQLIYGLRRVTTLQLQRRADRRQPDRIDDGVFRVAFGQLANDRLCLLRLATQRQRERRAWQRDAPACELQPLRGIGSDLPAISKDSPPQRLFGCIPRGYFLCVAARGHLNRAP